MAIVFVETDERTYDLLLHGRVIEYDVEPDGLQDALRRARGRLPAGQPVYVEDLTGYRQRLGR